VLDLDEFKAVKKEYDRKRYAKIQRDREALLIARKQERSRIWHEEAREHNRSQWSQLLEDAQREVDRLNAEINYMRTLGVDYLLAQVAKNKGKP
jgi:hypothetical protein